MLICRGKRDGQPHDMLLASLDALEVGQPDSELLKCLIELGGDDDDDVCERSPDANLHMLSSLVGLDNETDDDHASHTSSSSARAPSVVTAVSFTAVIIFDRSLGLKPADFFVRDVMAADENFSSHHLVSYLTVGPKHPTCSFRHLHVTCSLLP